MDNINGTPINEVDRLIMYNAKPWMPYYLNLGFTNDDILQIGRVGALKAKESYVEGKGTKWLSWLTTKIKGEFYLQTRNDGFHQYNKNKKEARKIIGSLNEFISANSDDGNSTELQDLIPDKDIWYYEDLSLSLKQALNVLEPKEKYVVTNVYLDMKTQHEVAKELGVAQTSVARYLKKSFKKMREVLQ